MRNRDRLLAIRPSKSVRKTIFHGTLLILPVYDGLPVARSWLKGKLREANFDGADLRGANLAEASLSGASFDEAVTDGCLGYP